MLTVTGIINHCTTLENNLCISGLTLCFAGITGTLTPKVKVSAIALSIRKLSEGDSVDLTIVYGLLSRDEVVSISCVRAESIIM